MKIEIIIYIMLSNNLKQTHLKKILLFFCKSFLKNCSPEIFDYSFPLISFPNKIKGIKGIHCLYINRYFGDFIHKLAP
jgi:hypothetical protein